MIVGHIGGGAGAPYEIEKSLRFRASSSAYLSRTFGTATNRNVWTWSKWVKRGDLGRAQILVGAQTDGNNLDFLGLKSDNTLNYYVRTGGVTQLDISSNVVFRDPSAHFHVVLSKNGTTVTCYVNNNQVFSTSSAPTNMLMNTAIAHYIGEEISIPNNTFDGYLSEINFIDGQALGPEHFGEVSSETGAWVPKKYTGTYGTNGFYLDFKDGNSTTTLGYDKSGNANNWTSSGHSLTADATYDWMDDTPTNNFAVLNPLTLRGATGTLSNGNLSVAASSSSSPADTSMYGTIALSPNSLIYLEALYTVTAGSGNDTRIGVSTVGDAGVYVQAGSTTGYWSYDYKNGTANAQGSNTSYTASTTGQIVMFAIDVASGKIWAGANGTWYNSGNPAAGTGAVLTGVSTSATNLQTTLNGWSNRCSLDFNFGQRPFAYTPPTGFKALCTKNLPEPGVAAKNPKKHFDIALNTGANIKTASEALFPSNFLEWIKDRGAANNHQLIDIVRGTSAVLQSNTTAAETAYVAPSSSSVGWVWKAGGSPVANTAGSITSQVSANPLAGFSIVSYNGSGAAATIGHGLGAVPSLIITKKRSSGGTANRNWPVRHKAVTDAFGNVECLSLNLTNARATQAQIYTTTAPTSSVYSVGTDTEVNESTYAYIAYCFAEIPGYSKIGSYTGNGLADGPFVYCGFRPRWVLIKRIDTTGDWQLLDTARSQSNLADARLWANLASAETANGAGGVDFVSNGFKLRGTVSNDSNANGGTYSYMAFAEHPFKYATAR